MTLETIDLTEVQPEEKRELNLAEVELEEDIRDIVEVLSTDDREILEGDLRDSLAERESIERELEEAIEEVRLQTPQGLSGERIDEINENRKALAKRMLYWTSNSSLSGMLAHTLIASETGVLELLGTLASYIHKIQLDLDDKGAFQEDRKSLIARDTRALELLITYEGYFQENRKRASQAFFRSIIDGQTLLAHYSPYSVKVIQSGGLAGKTKHGVTNVNPKFSFGVHFTSLELMQAGSSLLEKPRIDYRGYASYAIGQPEIHPGVFVADVASLYRAGYKNINLSRNSDFGDGRGMMRLSPILDLVMADDGDRSEVDMPIELFHYFPLSPDTEARERMPMARQALEDIKEAKEAIWKLRDDGEIDTPEAQRRIKEMHRDKLRQLIVAEIPEAKQTWAEKNVLPDVDLYFAEQSQKKSREKLVPLVRASRATGLQDEPLDSGSDSGAMRFALVNA